MQKTQRSKSIATERKKNSQRTEGNGTGWEIKNTFIEWENGTDSEEEEMIGEYPLWGAEDDKRPSFDFRSTIKLFMGETEEEGEIRTSFRHETFLNRYKGTWERVATQGVVPTKAPNTEDEAVRAYDKVDPK